MQKFILIALFVSIASANNIIESSKVTDWGSWGNWDRCPFGRYAQGIQVKTEPYQGSSPSQDDTAVNGIRLFCGDAYNASTQVITSSQSDWGNWGATLQCRKDGRPLAPDGYISGFQLRVEKPQIGDDTATNNIAAICKYPDGSEQVLQGDGLTYGSWGDNMRCSSNQYVCAIQTQVESYQGDDDDTALNNVAMECCDL